MSHHRITAAHIRALRAIASRRAFTPEEADDLVQDVLLAAMEQGRAVDDPRFPAWAAGTLRRRALFIARTAGRRRRREAEYAMSTDASPPRERRLPRRFIDSLAPSLQVIALLVNAGLGRAEIADLLRISDTALRQRISGLRRAWRRAGMAPEVLHVDPDRPSDGPRRRALKTTLGKLPKGRFAVADPDGHPIFIGRPAHDQGGAGN